MHATVLRDSRRLARPEPVPQGAPAARHAALMPALAMLAALGLVMWSLLGSGGAHGSQAAAHAGETVAVPGALVRVDQVMPEHMAPMHGDKFARSGMNMSGMGMDMAPPGYRRFTVAITLVGQASDGLRYSEDWFRLTGQGMTETGVYRHQFGTGAVPRGSAVSGSLTFQVPEGASGLLLHVRGGERPIALDPGPVSDQHEHVHGQ